MYDCIIQSIPYHIRLYSSFNAKKNIILKKPNIIWKKILYKPYSISQNDLFFLKFLISLDKRDLDPLTI